VDRCLARGFLFIVIAAAFTLTWSTASGVCYLTCPRGDNEATDPDLEGMRTVDFDFDGAVALADFAAFGFDFGDAGATCSDYDCDRDADLVDFARFAAHFGHAGGGFTACVL
jgi:hypothetical protein